MDDNKIFETTVEKSFTISCGTNLTAEITNIAIKFNSTVVGYSENEYLFIKMPSSANISLIKTKLYMGSRIIVRFIEDGVVYGFETDVWGTIIDPVKIIIIKYPKIISRYELREKQRYLCMLPGKLQKGQDIYPAIMTDVTENGCGIKIKARVSHLPIEFKVNDRITFNLVLPGSEGELSLSGHVRNLRHDKQEVFLGIKFIGFTLDMKNKINKYISFLSTAS